MIPRIKKAGGGNPPATTTRQTLSYQESAQVSTGNLLAAGEILLLLQLPLAEIEQVAFHCLLEQRLGRAYEGVTP